MLLGGESLHLTFPYLLSRRTDDRVDGGVEGASRRLDGRPTPQAMGVALGKASMMPRLNRGPRGTGRVQDLGEAHLALGTHVEMVLEQPAAQLPARFLQVLLQLGVLEAHGLLAGQEHRGLLEALP